MKAHVEVRVMFYSNMTPIVERASDDYPSPEAVLEGLEFLMKSGASREELQTFIEENYR